MSRGRFKQIGCHEDGRPIYVRRSMAGFLDRPGYIYGLHGDNGLVKLGCSDNVRRRMKQIKCDLPSLGVSVKHLASIFVEDMGFDERLLHWQFREFNSYSEWFRVSPDFVIDILTDWPERRVILASRMPDSFYLKGWKGDC